MKKEDFLNYRGKQIKIALRNGFIYTCTIEFLNEDSIHIKDKYDKRHVFAISNVVELSEVQP